jgi:hypothetical protein
VDDVKSRKMREVLRIVRERHPQLMIDGEMRADVAMQPLVSGCCFLLVVVVVIEMDVFKSVFNLFVPCVCPLSAGSIHVRSPHMLCFIATTIYICICMYVSMYACMYVCVCMYICMYVYMHFSCPLGRSMYTHHTCFAL